jgi:hypothetical protein
MLPFPFSSSNKAENLLGVKIKNKRLPAFLTLAFTWKWNNQRRIHFLTKKGLSQKGTLK